MNFQRKYINNNHSKILSISKLILLNKLRINYKTIQTEIDLSFIINKH